MYLHRRTLPRKIPVVQVLVPFHTHDLILCHRRGRWSLLEMLERHRSLSSRRRQMFPDCGRWNEFYQSLAQRNLMMEDNAKRNSTPKWFQIIINLSKTQNDLFLKGITFRLLNLVIGDTKAVNICFLPSSGRFCTTSRVDVKVSIIREILKIVHHLKIKHFYDIF